MAQSPEETRALVLRARAGSRDAFEALMKSHVGLVVAAATPHLSDRAEAEDVVQETFMIAWRELSRLKKPASFAPWISTIARNLARGAAVDRSRRPALDPGSTPPGTSQDQRETLYRTALAEMERLPDGYREVFLLRYVAEKDCASISEELGVALGTVTSRLSRGHQMLRESLGKAAQK